MNKNLQEMLRLPKKEKVSILPHDNADVDAILSSILLSKLLDYLNIDNEILILDQRVDEETKYFVEKLGYNPETYFCDTQEEKRNLFLVDHYETAHLGKVIGCIDHHFTTKKLSYSIYEYRDSCSTSYILYTFMLEVNMPITKEIAALLGYSTLIDTCSFTSTKTKKEEADIVLDLLAKYHFPVENMIEECLCIQDIATMSTEQIATNGLKCYMFGKYKVRSSYVQIGSLEIPEEVIAYLQKEAEKEELYMWAFIVLDVKNTITKVYYIERDNITTAKFSKILSRGKDIMPRLETYIYNLKDNLS